MKIEIVLPFKTPTVNHLYGNNLSGVGRIRYLKKEAKELKEWISTICLETRRQINITPLIDKKLSIHVEIYENWLTKKGEVKRTDLSNREKFIVDSVFNALNLDDKYIYEHKMSKVQSIKEEKSVITILSMVD